MIDNTDIIVNRLLNEQKIDAIKWANRNGYETKNNISKIPNGAMYYEVNTNNLYIGNQKTKRDDSAPESTKPLFIISDDRILQGSIENNLDPIKNGGRRKPRKNIRKSRKNIRKSRKLRRKSRKNRH